MQVLLKIFNIFYALTGDVSYSFFLDKKGTEKIKTRLIGPPLPRIRAVATALF
jgi:hypothetical protein